MSRGVGSLQRQILETLDRAKATALPYLGSGSERPGFPYGSDPAGWFWYGGHYLRLAPEAYDLRCSSAYLMGLCRLRGGNPGALNAAFPRAVKRLVARGCLTPLVLVPLTEIRPGPPATRSSRGVCGTLYRTADGLFLEPHRARQRRFVSRETLACLEAPPEEAW